MPIRIGEPINENGLVTYIDGAYTNSIATGSLVWKDIIRRNTDTTLINGAIYSTSKYNGGVVFDGVDDFVSVPYNYNLTTEPFAVEIWREHVSSGNSLQGILSCGNYLGSGAYGSPGWCIGYYNSNGTRIAASIGDSTSFNRYVFFNSATSISPFNKPQHLFFHRNTNTQTLSLFINGVKGSINFSNTITIGGGNRKSLGAQTWGYGSNVMVGACYMIKLYYNINYTDAEIVATFNSTRTRFGI